MLKPVYSLHARSARTVATLRPPRRIRQHGERGVVGQQAARCSKGWECVGGQRNGPGGHGCEHTHQGAAAGADPRAPRFGRGRAERSAMHCLTARLAQPNQQTALMIAAQSGRMDVVNALLALHADVNAVDVVGETALHYAARRGQDMIVDALLQAGCNPYCLSVGATSPAPWRVGCLSLTCDRRRSTTSPPWRLHAASARRARFGCWRRCAPTCCPPVHAPA